MSQLADVIRLREEGQVDAAAALRNGLQGDKRKNALLGLGSTFRAIGEYEKSLSIFDQGCREFSQNSALKVFRSLTLHNRGRSEEAIESLLIQLIETTSDAEIKSYNGALRFYSDKLNQVWKP